MTAALETKNIDCPHCKGKIEVEIERKPAKVHIEKQEDPQLPVSELEANIEKVLSKREAAMPRPREEKPVKEVVPMPSYIPKFKCKDGNCEVGAHKNRNYRKVPKSKCSNCDQFNPHDKGKCLWCDSEELEPIEKEELEELGIPLPSEDEHDHE